MSTVPAHPLTLFSTFKTSFILRQPQSLKGQLVKKHVIDLQILKDGVSVSRLRHCPLCDNAHVCEGAGTVGGDNDWSEGTSTQEAKDRFLCETNSQYLLF